MIVNSMLYENVVEIPQARHSITHTYLLQESNNRKNTRTHATGRSGDISNNNSFEYRDSTRVLRFV